jgi:4-hydroxybenzoate polyprenyltransferase
MRGAPTGEAPAARSPDPRRLVALVRLFHPFPSLLDGAVVALVALVAGGAPARALLLGISMTCLQFAIGAVNDLADAQADAGRKPGKPVPLGLVSAGRARMAAMIAASAGLLLAVAGGPGLLLLAVVGLAIGLVYDLWAKGTTMSWLPLAVGVPLLPVYGWYGATGELPGLFLVLIPAAANAGAALAIANAVVDMERDAAAGDRSIALALGARGASRLVLALHGVVALLAVATVAVTGAPVGWVAAVVLASLVPLGGAVLGLVAAARAGTGARELAFEVQAVGTGLLAVAWLGALSASQGTGTA